MNKKEAIAYAVIALNYLKCSGIDKEINLRNLSNEMNGAFKIYTKNVALIMSKSMLETESEFDDRK